MAPFEAFEEYPEWEAKGKEELAKKGAAFISVVSSDPDLLKGADGKRIAAFQKAAGKALHTYRQYIQSDKVSWTVIGAASTGWAKKCSRISRKKQPFSFYGKKFSKQPA